MYINNLYTCKTFNSFGNNAVILIVKIKNIIDENKNNETYFISEKLEIIYLFKKHKNFHLEYITNEISISIF